MTTPREVFSPGSYPRHTYVLRTFKELRGGKVKVRDPEEEIEKAFATDGVIVQITGPSKSGKTVMVERIFERSKMISIGGSRIIDAKELWRLVCAHLKIGVAHTKSQQTSERKRSTIEASATGKFVAADIKVGGSYSDESGRDHGTKYEVPDDFFTAATDALVNREMILFIDDFHTVPLEVRESVTHQLKLAIAKRVKVCLADVPHRADEPVKQVPDLTGRIRKIQFDHWGHEDLKEIAIKGFTALGVILNGSAVTALAAEASGSPQLMQHLCLGVCDHLGIRESIDPPKKFSLALDDLEVVFIDTLNVAERETICLALERGLRKEGEILEKHGMRGLENGTKYEFALGAMALNPPHINLPWDRGSDSVDSRIVKLKATPDQDQPSNEVIESTFSDLVRISASSSPKSPPIDFDVLKGVNILDPYFLYYLRWCKKYYDIRGAVK